MLRSLYIQNYVLIDRLTLSFSEQLTIITGETGAGKSIILGALGLIMGKRLEGQVLYHAEEKCVIEAKFELAAYNLKRFFEEQDLDYEAETVIRREISPTGKSRAFVNDTPVKLEVLRDLTARLIDLHQQFDTLGIDSLDFQRQLLDALAGSSDLYEAYRRDFRRWQKAQRELKTLRETISQAERERDFLEHQYRELDEAKLEIGEQEELEQEQALLGHAQDIKQALGFASEALVDSEQSVVERLRELNQQLEEVADYHPQLPSFTERLEGLRCELEEMGRDLSYLLEEVEDNPRRLEEVEERLNFLFRLQKKYYLNTEAELIEKRDSLAKRTQGMETLLEREAFLVEDLLKQEKDLRRLAQELTLKRREVVPSFEGDLRERLARLSMADARLEVFFEPQERLQDYGLDLVRFKFAANKGGQMQELRQAVSGGERSRLALCIKSLVAGAMALPTLIFDEIDAGVSGEVARQMGLIFKDLASKHQMISITHSPQIASKAALHLFVHKRTIGERTRTEVRVLALEEERCYEIAKMLSGDPPADSALLNARTLLSEV